MVKTALSPPTCGQGYRLQVERSMALPTNVLYRAWTEQIDRWFAAPGSVLMTPTVDAPFYFQTDFHGQRHPHYGRFLRLEPDQLVELSWVTGAGGTEGAETVVTVELDAEATKRGTRLRLTQAGFPHEQARDGAEQAWPMVLQQMEQRLSPTR